MTEDEKRVALDALGISEEDFAEFVAEQRAEGNQISEQDLIVHMHVVNIAMMVSEQTGIDVDTILDRMPEGPIDLIITVNDDGDYDITVEFSQPSDESETG